MSLSSHYKPFFMSGLHIVRAHIVIRGGGHLMLTYITYAALCKGVTQSRSVFPGCAKPYVRYSLFDQTDGPLEHVFTI